MSMQRTNVYADPDDLALIKQAAARKGLSEAEIIRRALHLAALGEREWQDSFVKETYDLGGPISADDVREVTGKKRTGDTGKKNTGARDAA